jgi:DNA polymerase-3 subunit gamma/tau
MEGVSIEPAALPLVVRAGAGSARDTLSVLDQLIGGAGPDGVTHTLASGLLGYTPDALLDEVVDAFAAGDGAAVFGVVDKVIETGQDPRRFTEDLLRRLRDLVILNAVPGATASGLIDVPEDQGERLVAQAARFGSADLSRAADLLATGLTEMRGATAPRLLLELICARVLLPGADHGTEGLAARIERLERRMTISGTPTPAAPPVAPPAQDRPAPAPTAVGNPLQPEPDPEPAPAPVAVPQAPPAAQETAPKATAAPAAPAASSDSASGGLSLVDVRRLWPDIVEATKLRRRIAWIHLSQNCQVVNLEGNVLTLGFANPGARDSFMASGCHEVVHQAAIDVVGADWRIDTIVDPGAQASDTPHVTKPAVSAGAGAASPQDAAAGDAVPGPPGWADDEPAQAAASTHSRSAARSAPGPALSAADADAHPDDRDADTDGVGGEDLLTRELGAEMIEEIRHP